MSGWASRVVAALLVVGGGLSASPVAACTCLRESPTLAEMAAAEETSLVAAVRLQEFERASSTERGPLPGFDYIDGEVLEALKGELSRPRIVSGTWPPERAVEVA